MKRNTLLSAVLALALVLTAVLSGCGGSKLAAKVGDRSVTVAQLENGYNYYYQNGYYSVNTEEQVEKLQDDVLDSLIRYQMIYYQAKLAGVELTDEEEAACKTAADKSYDDTYQQYVDYAKSSSSQDVNAYAQKMFTEMLVKSNKTVSSFKKELLESEENEKLAAKHKEQLLSASQLTDEEIKTRYDEELATQKELFDTSAGMYFTYQASYQYGYSYMPLYVPAGLFRVKHILVADEETAKEVKAKVDAGEDFDTLITEYNTDPGMSSEENKDGYLIGEGASYDSDFLAAALALTEDGQVSDVVKSTYGYHIIKRVSTEASHEIPFEEVSEEFAKIAQTNVDNEKYNEIVDGWLADESLVVKYPENYRSIGKATLATLTPTPVPEATVTPEVTDAPETSEAPETTEAAQ